MFKRAIVLLLSIGVMLFAYFLAPELLGYTVQEVFKNGTNCKVSITDPQISFLELKGSLKNGYIECKDDFNAQDNSLNGYFKFDKIEVSLNLSEILSRSIVISDVNITGASVISLGSESAFIKTLKFILSDNGKKSFWHVWAPKVRIYGAKFDSIDSDLMPAVTPAVTSTVTANKSNFIFGTKAAYIAGNVDYFYATDPVDSPTSTILLESKASDVQFSFLKNKEQLGNLDFIAGVKEGVVKFDKCISSRDQEFIEVKGDIVSKTEVMNFTYQGQRKFNILETIKSSKDSTDLSNKFLYLNGAISGTIDSPVTSVSISDSQQDSELYVKSNVSYNSEIRKLNINELEFYTKYFSILSNYFVSSNLISAEFAEKLSTDISQFKTIGKGLVNFNDLFLSDVTLDSNLKIRNEDFILKLISKAERQSLLLTNLESVHPIIDLSSNLKDKNMPLTGNVSIINFPIGDYFLSKFIKESKDILLTLNGIITGALSSDTGPLLNGKLEIFNKSKKVNILQSDYIVNKTRAEIKGTLSDNHGDFKIEFPSFKDFDFKLNFKSLPLDIFNLGESFAFKTTELSGSFNLKTKLSDLNQNSALLNISSIKLPVDEKNLKIELPLNVEMNNSKVNLGAIRAYFSGQLFTITGGYDLIDGIKVKASGSFFPGEILTFGRHLEGIKGALLIDASISGQLSSPAIFGNIILDDLSFSSQLGRTVLGVDNINGRVVFDGKNVLVQEIRGELSDGKFYLRGALSDILDSQLRRGELLFDAKDVKLEPDVGLFIDTSSNLKLDIVKNLPPILSGEIKIEEGNYSSEINLESLLKALTKFALGGFGLKKENSIANKSSGVAANIHISTPSSLVIDTNVLQAEVNTDLFIRSDLFNPHIEGNIEVVDGSFKINQTNFQILGGKIIFNDNINELNPDISVTSEGSLTSLNSNFTQVYLSVVGKLRDYKVSLTSDSVSTPQDLARQLGIGTGGNQFQLVQGDKKNIGFRELISPSSNLSLSERFAGITGFDDIRVENTVSARTGEFVPQVIAGRQLVPDYRLNLSSELAGDRASGSRVEYRLDDTFSLFSSWRSQAVTDANRTGGGNFGLGIIFSKTFKGFSLGTIFSNSRAEVIDRDEVEVLK